MNYYNENDKYAAEWLRNLIADGQIPDGKVDTRSIEDVRPADLVGFTQHHFFCGIAGWPLALDLAGWPRNRPVFTGSCPCQPFSAAGKGAGTDDERHLWPAFHHLISQLSPSIVFGEQVASKQALEWWDIVASDLEGSGYACAAADLPAASVEAPHLRSRLFWVATRGMQRRGEWQFDELPNADLQRCNGQRIQLEPGQKGAEVAWRSAADKLPNTDSGRFDGRQNGKGNEPDRENAGWAKGISEPQPCVGAGELGNSENERLRQSNASNGQQATARGSVLFGSMAHGNEIGRERSGNARGRRAGLANHGENDELGNSSGARLAGRPNVSGNDGQELSPIERASRDVDGPGQSESFWANADWVGCTDGNWRAAKPGTRVLDARVSGRVVIQRPDGTSHAYSARSAIKGFGNAIVPQVAAEFIRSLM